VTNEIRPTRTERTTCPRCGCEWDVPIMGDAPGMKAVFGDVIPIPCPTCAPLVADEAERKDI